LEPFPAAEDDTVPGGVEVGGGDDGVTARGGDRGLAGQVGAGEAGRNARRHVEIHIGGQVLLAADVHRQDRGPLANVRQRNGHLPVEAAGAQEGRA